MTTTTNISNLDKDNILQQYNQMKRQKLNEVINQNNPNQLQQNLGLLQVMTSSANVVSNNQNQKNNDTSQQNNLQKGQITYSNAVLENLLYRNSGNRN